MGEEAEFNEPVKTQLANAELQRRVGLHIAIEEVKRLRDEWTNQEGPFTSGWCVAAIEIISALESLKGKAPESDPLQAALHEASVWRGFILAEYGDVWEAMGRKPEDLSADDVGTLIEAVVALRRVPVEAPVEFHACDYDYTDDGLCIICGLPDPQS